MTDELNHSGVCSKTKIAKFKYKGQVGIFAIWSFVGLWLGGFIRPCHQRKRQNWVGNLGQCVKGLIRREWRRATIMEWVQSNVKLRFMSSAFAGGANTYSFHHQYNHQKVLRRVSYSRHARITAFGSDRHRFMGVWSTEKTQLPRMVEIPYKISALDFGYLENKWFLTNIKLSNIEGMMDQHLISTFLKFVELLSSSPTFSMTTIPRMQPSLQQ